MWGFFLDGNQDRGEPVSGDLVHPPLVKCHLSGISVLGNLTGKLVRRGIRRRLQVNNQFPVRLQGINPALHPQPVFSKLLRPVGRALPVSVHQEGPCHRMGPDCLTDPLDHFPLRLQEDPFLGIDCPFLISLGIPRSDLDHFKQF